MLAVSDGHVVGYAGVDTEGAGTANVVDESCVHPDFRRRRIATALVHAGEQRLAAKGATRIIAAVGRENSAATRFWKSVGYDVQDVYRLFKDIG